MNHYSVLIVGAGPTGLFMAEELARHGIQFRVIDKKANIQRVANAIWIQSRTLEMFDQLGMIDAFLRLGHRCRAISLYAKEKQLVSVPLNNVDSIYPFAIMLPQWETEKILHDRLQQMGHQAERSIELINIVQENDKVIATLKHQHGSTETVSCDWLIGCDGANSTVRAKINMPFPGETITQQFVMADVIMDSFLPPDEVHLFFNNETIFIALPRGTKHYRIGGNLQVDAPRKLYTEREVKELVAERTFGNYVVEKILSISPFWIHSKIVSDLRSGRVFLAGDAAHIHSPAGGQGMNSGMQDAYNLAWKLALVINKQAKESLLDTYALERYPVMKALVDRTDEVTKMALDDQAFLRKLRSFTRKVTRSHIRLSKKIGTEITEVGIRYQSPIIEQLSPSVKSPRAGERAPDVVLSSNKNLYHYFREPKHYVLLFTGVAPTEKQLLKIQDIKTKIFKNYANKVMDVIIVSSVATNQEVLNQLIDTEGKIHNAYAVKLSTICVVRPDTYLAYRSKRLSFSVLNRFLRHYLI